jgi:xylulokinase
MSYVMGLDASTQSLSAVVIDTGTLTVCHEASVNFGDDLPEYGCPSGFLEDLPEGRVHSDPLMWLAALDLLLARLGNDNAPLNQLAAVSGAGQQHGSVYLNNRFYDCLKALSPKQSLADQIEPSLSRETAPIWMDSSTAQECREIEQTLGGADEVCRRTGSVCTERFTGPQIRAFASRAPLEYTETRHIHLVSSFLCSVLAGVESPIDYGDGAGMNLMNLAQQAWDQDLLAATADGLDGRLPPLVASNHIVGPIGSYFVEKYGLNPDCSVQAFTGDNPASLVGMGASVPGSVVISLGTSDTVFSAMAKLETNPGDSAHVFGNPLGGFMILGCFANGSLSREAFCDHLGVGWDIVEQAAGTMLDGEQLCLPFMLNEISPIRQAGLVESHPTAPVTQRIRAFLEGQAFNMRRQLEGMSIPVDSIHLTGGASRNGGIAQVISDVFDVTVQRLADNGSGASSVAMGCAMRAAVSQGVDRESLEVAFCQPDPGSMRTPGPGQSGCNQRYQAWLELLG